MVKFQTTLNFFINIVPQVQLSFLAINSCIKQHHEHLWHAFERKSIYWILNLLNEERHKHHNSHCEGKFRLIRTTAAKWLTLTYKLIFEISLQRLNRCVYKYSILRSKPTDRHKCRDSQHREKVTKSETIDREKMLVATV